jgi:hypothetical protein
VPVVVVVVVVVVVPVFEPVVPRAGGAGGGAVVDCTPSLADTSAGPQNGWLAPARRRRGAIEPQSPPEMSPTAVTYTPSGLAYARALPSGDQLGSS